MEKNLDFNFESASGDFDGFSLDLDSLQGTSTTSDEDIDDTNDEDIDENKVDENEEDVDLEKEEDQDDDQDNDDDSQEDDNDVDYSYLALNNHLSSLGIIDELDDPDIEDTPEALEKAVEKTIFNGIDSYKESIPEEGKHFLNYLEKGGDPTKYFKAIESRVSLDSIDLTNEDHQKEVYRQYLENLDYTEEEIEDELTDAEVNDLLEKKAKIASKKLEKINIDKREKLIAEQEELNTKAAENHKKYLDGVKGTIQNSTQLAGLAISPSDKTEFEKYLLAKDKEGLSKYERDLKEDPVKTAIELAYLKFKKFDYSKIANKAKTEESRRIKGLIKNQNKSTSRSNVSGGSTKDPISGFRGLL